MGRMRNDAPYCSVFWLCRRAVAVVKVCGCRPHDGGAARMGAGVRKPPKEETAGSRTRWRVRRYGDFGAGSER